MTTVLHIVVHAQSGGEGPIFNQPTPIPVTLDVLALTQTQAAISQSLGNLNATGTAQSAALAETQTAFAGSQTAFVIQVTADAAALQTQQALLAQQSELAATQTAFAIVETAFALSQTPPAATPAASLTPSLTPSATLVPSPTQDSVATLAAGTMLALNQTATQDASNFSATQTVQMLTYEALEATATAQAQPLPTIAAPATPFEVTMASQFLDLIWRQNFIVLINLDPRPLNLTNIVLRGPNGSEIATSEWATYGANISALGSRGCLVAFISTEMQPTPEELTQAGVRCEGEAYYLGIDPGNAVWGQPQLGDFSVFDGEIQIANCTPRSISSCSVPMGVIAPTGVPSGSPPSPGPGTVLATWNSQQLVITNTSNAPIDLSGLTISRGGTIINVATLVGGNRLLRSISPNGCIFIASFSFSNQTATPPPPAGCTSAITLLIDGSFFLWAQGNDPFIINIGGIATECNPAVGSCHVGVP